MSLNESSRQVGDAPGEYWPSASVWAQAEPGSARMDAGRLGAAVEAALADKSYAVVVLRGGRIVAERYAKGLGPSDAYQVASVAKSMVAVLVGVAIDEGKIAGLDQRAADFIAPWRDDARAGITLRHLLTMTSGLDFGGLAVREIAGDQFAINAAAAPIAAPGAEWAYSTPMFHLLYHVLERATGERFQDFARRSLTGPLGMDDTRWVTSQGRGALGPVTNFYTAACSARDLARFGLFALRGGRWGDRQLVNADYLRAAVSPSQSVNPAYGLLWWNNARPGRRAMETAGPARFVFEHAPRDTFAALGFGGQAVMVAPSLDLVVVRQGEAPGPERIESLLAEVCASSAV